MRNVVKIAIALLVGLSLFYFIVREAGFDVLVRSASIFFNWKGAFLLLFSFIAVFLGAIRWRFILITAKSDLPLILSMRYQIKGFMVDYLTPFAFFGGEAVRIFLLERRVGLEKSIFASVTDKITAITAHSIFLLSGTVIFLFYGALDSKILLTYAILAILFVCGLLALFYVQALRNKSFLKLLFHFSGSIRKILKDTENGQKVMEIERSIISFFFNQKKDLLKSIFIGVVANVFLAGRVFLIIYFITGSYDVFLALIIYSLVILSLFLPLPASIGGMEVILGIGFTVLGMSLSQGIITAIIVRSADLVICLVGIILFLRMSAFSFLRDFSAFLKKGF